MKIISLIVPIFNEEISIIEFDKIIKKFALDFSNLKFEVIFIDGNSTDNSTSIINNLSSSDLIQYSLIKLVGNFGKEAALLAGLRTCTGDAAIPLDVDLQDPIETIKDFYKLWLEGSNHIVAVRNDRSNDKFIYRIFTYIFYKLFKSISTVPLEPNAGDFRLIDREVINRINQISENQLFMKGLYAWAEPDYKVINVKRLNRLHGVGKFNFFSNINNALSGITSFSIAPIRIFSYISLIIFILSFLYILFFIIIKYYVYGGIIAGYSSIIASVIFFGSLNGLGIGLVGEYVGRTLLESKKRPQYIIKSESDKDN
tara:strand:- start:1047 stop:1988 length:942 start_codon:yes stop_codon:yes gene_type:complete